jgi:signal transduction histidine kinase
VVVTVDVPADLPPLFGMQVELEQLLLNLLSNACDATRPGDAVTVRATCAGNLLELVVEDTGCGIPREHLARLQEPFFTTKANGHGLGLAICRSIVAGMRGRLHIESTPGAGTRVRAALPIDGSEVAS